MCVREINFAAFRIRRVVAAHNFPEQIINLVENWRGGGIGRRIRMPRVRSKRRFYDRGRRRRDGEMMMIGRNGASKAITLSLSLSLGIRLERKAGERDFFSLFFFGARGLREREGEGEREASAR